MPEPLVAWITNKAFLVRPDGMCLFLRDSGAEPGHAVSKGWWDLPGGRMDIGDIDFIASMRRELREESGYDLREKHPVEHVSTQFWRRADGQYMLGNFYRIDVDEAFDPVISEEHSELVWNTVTAQVSLLNENDAPYIGALMDYIKRYET